MMTYSRTLSSLRLSTFAIAILNISTVQAEGVSLNYETLSSIEEPIATHVGDTTIELTGLIDTPLNYDIDGDDDTEVEFIGNFQISAETQLDNNLTIGAVYFGQYESGVDDDYIDNAAAYAGGVWGTVFAGNVTGLVHEQTRRNRGTGNAELAFDQPLASLADDGIAYIGRYGPVKISSVFDEDNNFDLGLEFQRPIGNKDYRFSTRYTESIYNTADGMIEFDSKALSLVGELVYGSSLFDLSLGYEQLTSSAVEANRWYISTGAARKHGVWTVSASAHYGEIEDQKETSASLGLRYDIARGLSVNVGLNYQDADINIDGINIVNDDQTTAILSLRYSF